MKRPGEQLQIDSGGTTVPIGGDRVKVHLFVATLCYSRRPYVAVFTHERQSAWWEGRKVAIGLTLTMLALTGGVHTSAWAKQEDHEKRNRHHTRGGDDRHHEYRGRHFSESDRLVVHEYYENQFRRRQCPPGLAKKRDGCMPPGQAKKWHVGQRLPKRVVYYEVPPAVIVHLPPPNRGYRYVRVASDILLIAIGTGMIIDAIQDLGRM